MPRTTAAPASSPWRRSLEMEAGEEVFDPGSAR
jgi:hypothetical protein